MSLNHYTDINALHGILTNQELWLSDIRYMNDSSELNHGLDLVIKQVREGWPKLSTIKVRKYTPSNIALSLDRTENYLRMGKEISLAVCSFSGHGNRLSQWRGYCPKSGGYSIEFDKEALLRGQSYVHFSECIYSSNEQLHRSEEYSQKILEILRDRIADEDFKSEFYEVLEDIWDEVARFKHPSFIEEDETRLILRTLESEYAYRPKGNLLIPYCKLKFPYDAIKSITVGPMLHQSLAERSLNKFLTKTNKGEFSQIIVKCSQIPYRAL